MNILVIAPHADDEVLGVGGSILKHKEDGNSVFVCIVTSPAPPVFDSDTLLPMIRSEASEAHEILGVKKTFYCNIPAVMVENTPRYELNNQLFKIVDEVKPEVVYIPHFGDMQKDHKLIAEAMMVIVRPRDNNNVKKVYAYETLSETEWNIPHATNAFLPNVFNDITGYLELKKKAMQCYQSQVSQFPALRSLGAVEALAKYRGATIGVMAAEAFMLVREVS